MRRYLNEGKIDSLNDEIFVRAEPIPVQCYLAELAMLWGTIYSRITNHQRVFAMHHEFIMSYK